MSYPCVHSGKIRDLYELPDGNLLIVTSDRISAFDHVLRTPIPDKGKILTQLSLWWFERLSDVVPNHVISAEPPPGAPGEWKGRAIVVRPLDMIPVECVARGYLAGAALEDYQRGSTVFGVLLPPGLAEGGRLPEVIFTPTTKAPPGQHDMPMAYPEVELEIGGDVAAELRRITLQVYLRGAELAQNQGIIVADTKIELGFGSDRELVLGDEVLTPDSSRFWPADEWQPGRPQRSFDKQYVRDWLVSPASGWDRGSAEPPPPLPDEVVQRTRDKYIEAYERLTGSTWT